jgi:hypothetical protein
MCSTGLALKFEVLTTLDLSRNRLTSCRPFAHLDTLNELWISSNEIATFEDVGYISILGTREGACLTEVYLEHNPIYNDFEYRKKLKDMIPSLEKIDANDIGGTGYGSVLPASRSPEAMIEQMRILQEKAVQRAKEEQDKGAKYKGEEEEGEGH